MRRDQTEGTRDAAEDDIKAFCRAQITHFKVSKYVRFVTEYQRSRPARFRNLLCGR